MNTHDMMIGMMEITGERLSNQSLQGYVGGQVEFHYRRSPNMRIVGQIDRINLSSHAIDVDCAKVMFMPNRRCRKWRADARIPKEFTLMLSRGYQRRGLGEIVVLGQDANMFLRPADHIDNVEL